MLRLLLLALSIMFCVPLPVSAQQAFSLRSDAGEMVMNFQVPAELEQQAMQLQGRGEMGAARGDITLILFYDYNCGYCRASSPEIRKLVASDPNLRVVLVGVPFLSAGSVQAHKVEAAVARMGSRPLFVRFHERMMDRRGQIDGSVALEVAADVGLSRQKVEEMADGADVSDIVRTHLRAANALNVTATPAFVLQGVAFMGFPGPKTLRTLIANVRRCERVMCG